MIGIGLLGPVTIKVDGRSLVPPSSQKGRALLGQLALGAQPISRELLAETFWPDTSRRSALASLSTELAKLRTALGHAGDRIARHRSTLAFLGDDITVDAREFDDAVAVHDFARAIALWRGQFMQDTEHPWVARERERYRRKMLRSLDGAAEAAEREDDLDAAIDLVERRLAIAPEDERAMAKLLSILVRTGDEAAARRSYQRFSQAAMERGATLSAKVVAAMSRRPESDTATVSALLVDRPPQPLTTGLRDLDAIIGELPTGLVVVASRPRVGATTLLLQLQAHAAIEHHAPTLVFSPDQTESALASRLIAMTASIRIDDLRRGRVPPQRWPKIVAASSSLAGAPLFIDDSSYLQLSEIEDKVHRHAAAHGAPSLIVVDDLPALDEPPARAAEVMAALRRLGRRYEATVVVATQVHLRVEQRTDKRPLVADIAGWDPVVARPDLVLLLYRHELYFPDDEREDELDIIVAENRQGPLGIATVGLRPRYGAIAPDGDAA